MKSLMFSHGWSYNNSRETLSCICQGPSKDVGTLSMKGEVLILAMETHSFMGWNHREQDDSVRGVIYIYTYTGISISWESHTF